MMKPELDVVHKAGEKAVEFTVSDSAQIEDTLAQTKSDSKTVNAKRFPVETDPSRDALLTDFGKDTLKGPLFAARRILPGSVRPRRRRLRRRCAARPAHLRLHLPPLVHAGDPGALQRRHRPRPADLLLSQQRLRQPRRHRRYLERECLAGRARRRHRHLLGQCPRHRRGGRPQRQDQRHHPVRPRHG